MRLNIAVELDYDLAGPCDILLAVQVAPMADQRLIDDMLSASASEPLIALPGEESIGQRCWARSEGRFVATYRATVAIERPLVALESLDAVPPRALPGLVMPYLFASRYCQSDRLAAFVARTFDGVEGGAKVAAMADWICTHVDYRSGTSDGNTTATDTFVSRQGVCRDFAHLMASFSRAAGIPARLVSVYALGLEPPDFHAVVEVWLDEAWHFVDATGLALPDGFARIGVGRDATDIAFMTIFGEAMLNAQSVEVTGG
jgi:transglutaminase-like putative cysteine protease